MRIFLLITIAFFFSDLRAQSENYLYKAKFIRAAPGKLLDLIDLYKERMSIYDTAGVERPFWMRHSQGDQWDLMILFPIGSYENYYSSTKIQKRKRAFSEHPEFDRKHREYVAWQEEVYVFGAPLEAVREMFANTSFYHVEIFRALPGKHDEPYQQRQMENVYLKKLSRPQNLIFVHDQGAGWDAFTIGCYRDLKHFAESVDIPEAEEDKAAKLAGFEAANRIGTYLRTLISEHHDTLAVRIR